MLDPNDGLRHIARRLSREFTAARIVTSHMVLVEVLNALRMPNARNAAVKFATSLLADPKIIVVSQTARLFSSALALYRDREDQAWSLTDCASFDIMRRRKIREALAHDVHFEQAGFVALLRH